MLLVTFACPCTEVVDGNSRGPDHFLRVTTEIMKAVSRPPVTPRPTYGIDVNPFFFWGGRSVFTVSIRAFKNLRLNAIGNLSKLLSSLK